MSLTREAGIPEIPGLACAALEQIFGADGATHLAPDSDPAVREEAGPAGAPPSVLVVEPRADLSATIAASLRQEGLEVCTATDGLAAVYGLRHHWPDAVVLDLDVPGVSGFRLMRLLKEDRTADPPPVLVVTSLSFEEALDAIRAGADDLLELPCAPEEVVWRVQRLLAHRLLPAYEPFSWREDTNTHRTAARTSSGAAVRVMTHDSTHTHRRRAEREGRKEVKLWPT